MGVLNAQDKSNDFSRNPKTFETKILRQMSIAFRTKTKDLERETKNVDYRSDQVFLRKTGV